MSASEPTLDSLAVTISETAEAITSYFASKGQPSPTFAEDSTTTYPMVPEIIGARFQLLEAIHDLQLLVEGANDHLFCAPFLRNHDNMVLDVLNQFSIFTAVPLGKSASYKEIAQKASLPENVVRRILRHAFTMRIFAEAPPGSGKVVHTATSAHAARVPGFKNWLSHSLEEVRPGTFYVPEALRLYSGNGKLTEEITESGLSLADLDKTGSPTTFWDYLKHYQKGEEEGFRATRFAGAMRMAAGSSTISVQDVVKDGFDWKSVGDATIVDVGGSSGHDAISLAQTFSRPKFIVQDLPEVEKSFVSNVPQDLKSRISFQAHDFFTKQNTMADLFFLKMILHDWPDKYAAKILQNLVPSLKPGGRIVLCEAVSLPIHDTEGNFLLPLTPRRITSAADLQMLTAFNSLERTQKDWESVLQKADSRLKINKISSFPGSLWSIVEIFMDS